MVLLESKKKLSTGDSAPYFILRGIDGKDHALKEFSGKPTLIIFMCNHCPYVRAKISTMKKLHEKFGDKINFAGINSNDPEYEGEGFENMKSFAKEFGISFQYLIDDSQKVAKSYGAVCTPDPFLFDAQGKLVYHGRFDSSMTIDAKTGGDVMEDNLNKILSGKKIEKDFLPSQGCSIKWKNA